MNDLKEEEPVGTKVIELQASANQGDEIEYQIIAGDEDGKSALYVNKDYVNEDYVNEELCK